ncbi:50S ribosomal protein L10 [Tessaracoccus sp. OH4464_COT-324]|uniref:50S ribosomal protein L10 n=1 Tax=Tessaracoccus sp. OH4464_COT-324 TaxID=2491059 RepID=UPI000F639666|nr:50S ribosomal protein L10 [Tessaracoccus sp. OH4464_COT-324]RRD47013.1 50S ribosomal protein L10 [Tessaracoccus sp. OH4464_COT-324]
MARPDKVAKVEELVAQFNNSAAAVLTEYRGLTVKDLQTLRRSFGGDATYAVAKNTLTRIAAKEAGIEGLEETLTGPTAIAFISGDVATVTKGLKNFAKDNPSLAIKGGVMDGKFLDAKAVLKLADLESREVLLSKMAGALKANLSKAAFAFAAPAAKLARVMGALEGKAKENPEVIGGAGSQPAAEATETPAAEAATEAAEAAE